AVKNLIGKLWISGSSSEPKNPPRNQINGPPTGADKSVPVNDELTSGEAPAQAQDDPTNMHVENPRLDRFVAVLERGLSVSHVRDTQALKISFTHTDPALAALIANGVAQSFIQLNFENKIDKFTNTSNWLDRSTRELKAKVQEA